MSVARDLFEDLKRRPMPEHVAGRLLMLPTIKRDKTMAGILQKVARNATPNSSMSQSWFQVVDKAKQIELAKVLFAAYLKKHPFKPVRWSVEAHGDKFLRHLSNSLGRSVGEIDMKGDRLTRKDRKKNRIFYKAKNAYNKRFRFLVRLEGHFDTYKKEYRLSNYRLLGKAGLVDAIQYNDFIKSPWGMAFVSYYTARKNRRSTFTNDSQSRPMDTVAKALLEKCKTDPKTNWAVIAAVLPEKDVLARLKSRTKGKFLGMWSNSLMGITNDLERMWRDGRINLETMIVRRGNDSTGWNITAQAWNAARTSWMAMLVDLGQDGLLTKVLPGKVMRLMAADVAHWHRATGGELHPDTRVWSALPKPWEVLRGDVLCTRQMVESACRSAGLDPKKSGWVEPRVSTKAEAYKPTPELVHGVEVVSPEFALLFRKWGVFSGKSKGKSLNLNRNHDFLGGIPSR